MERCSWRRRLKLRRALAGRAGAEKPLEDQARIGFGGHGRRVANSRRDCIDRRRNSRNRRRRSGARFRRSIPATESASATRFRGPGPGRWKCPHEYPWRFFSCARRSERCRWRGRDRPPRLPGCALRSSRPPRTWMCCRHGLQRLQRLAQLKILSFLGRPPGGGNGAVGEIQEGRAQRRARGGGGQLARGRCGQQSCRHQRRKGRQGDARAQAAQEMPSRETVPRPNRRTLAGKVVC